MSILNNPPDQRKSTGQGTTRGYHVEFRTPGGMDMPFAVQGLEVTATWRGLPTKISYDGIPIEIGYTMPALLMADLVSYPCAEALRWHFVALCRAAYKDVETRIVEHSIEWQWSSGPTKAFAEYPHGQAEEPEPPTP